MNDYLKKLLEKLGSDGILAVIIWFLLDNVTRKLDYIIMLLQSP